MVTPVEKPCLRQFNKGNSSFEVPITYRRVDATGRFRNQILKEKELPHIYFIRRNPDKKGFCNLTLD
jgi:hypothetical protein